MRYAMLILLMTTIAQAAPSDICQSREQRCELKCSQKNQVGSMAHLKCNEECRADAAVCSMERK